VITKDMLNAIKQSNVSKNAELTKERVTEVWNYMSREQHKELYKYGISNAMIGRSKKLGNMAVKVASAFALACGVNPYYLTAEQEQNNYDADEEKVRQFIIEHGYEKALGIITDDSDKKIYGKKTTEPKPEYVAEVVVEPIIVEAPERGIMPLEEFAGAQMESMAPEKLDKLYAMTDEEITCFMTTLTMQAKYSDRAKDLLGLLRLILIR